MIPNYMRSSASPFPVDPSEDHERQHHQFFVPNYQSASSSSLSCHVFFNSTQDQAEYYRSEMHQPLHQQEDENHTPFSGSHDPEKKANRSLKLSLWKNEDQAEENPVKWMSSKMRLMQKMKNSDRKEITSSSAVKFEDKKQPSSSPGTDHFSSNSSSSNSNTPIRVCADCNTTKTPLWRSGPRGPKSLCNACGIRQRKARRAMAAAAANGTGPTSEPTAALKMKVKNKEKIKNNGHAAHLKKRCKITAESPDHEKKKNGFEDFLFNLSKNLAFQRVFPQDEKEAAILLMALSYGLVHS